jgi:hypothetical protein
MEDKYKFYYESLEHVIQKEIDKIAKCIYKKDICPPEFIVSILYNGEEEHKIILTIRHLGSTFSRILFPIKKNHYGYDNLKDSIVYLYNQTM